jgi:hypothetical protein
MQRGAISLNQALASLRAVSPSFAALRPTSAS